MGSFNIEHKYSIADINTLTNLAKFYQIYEVKNKERRLQKHFSV